MPIERAEALGDAPEDPLLFFSALYGIWVANLVAFNGDTCRDLAADFLSVAEKQRAAIPRMVGHRIVATSLLCAGELVKARLHFDQALSLYDPTEHGRLATLFGHDNKVAILTYRSRDLWLLGYPDQALADIDRALADAWEIGFSPSLMLALTYASSNYRSCGKYDAANAFADELIALAEEKSAAIWQAFGMINKGYAMAARGKALDAVPLLTSAVMAWRSTAATIPSSLSFLARGHSQLGQFERLCVALAKRSAP